MAFSEKELSVIEAAKIKVKFASAIRILVISIMVCGIAMMVAGILVADHIIYLSLAAVALAIAHPQFGSGPKYEDLVNILESKAHDANSQI